MVCLQFKDRIAANSTKVVSRYTFSKTFKPKSIKVVNGATKYLLINAIAINGKKLLDSTTSVIVLQNIGALVAQRLELIPALGDVKVEFQNVSHMPIDFNIEVWGELQ